MDVEEGVDDVWGFEFSADEEENMNDASHLVPEKGTTPTDEELMRY